MKRFILFSVVAHCVSAAWESSPILERILQHLSARHLCRENGLRHFQFHNDNQDCEPCNWVPPQQDCASCPNCLAAQAFDKAGNEFPDESPSSYSIETTPSETTISSTTLAKAKRDMSVSTTQPSQFDLTYQTSTSLETEEIPPSLITVTTPVTMTFSEETSVTPESNDANTMIKGAMFRSENSGTTEQSEEHLTSSTTLMMPFLETTMIEPTNGTTFNESFESRNSEKLQLPFNRTKFDLEVIDNETSVETLTNCTESSSGVRSRCKEDEFYNLVNVSSLRSWKSEGKPPLPSNETRLGSEEATNSTDFSDSEYGFDYDYEELPKSDE